LFVLTGKTTLLINVICQYLIKYQSEKPSEKKRLLVCAPTNKAISVLASRFLSATSFINEVTGHSCVPVLVGDEAKLLRNDYNVNESKGQSHDINNLKDIYLYSWNENLISSYTQLQNSLRQFNTEKAIGDIEGVASCLEDKLKRCTYFPEHVFEFANGIKPLIRKLKEKKTTVSTVIETIDEFLTILSQTKVDDNLMYSHILASADIIFCTLCTSGSLLFKQSNIQIQDLIVDEAAATSEPELCIPFHLHPRRLLAVGDPMQLPATIKSPCAVEYGLSKSLHQRLMNDCRRDFIMLNKQYRMHPQISQFPSQRFYESKIKDSKRVAKNEYISGIQMLDRCPYRFIHVQGEEQCDQNKSYYNVAEAAQIVDLVCQLRKNNTSMTAGSSKERKEQTPWYSADRIRVITFYQGQVRYIKRLLKSKRLDHCIDVSTVDASQGCEADTVLISFVRSQPDNMFVKSVGFLQDYRRINVALTRARHQVICVGNIYRFQNLNCANTMRALCINAIERNVVLQQNASAQDVPGK
jgi:superfamily I DNA and/or RNA helicase